MLSHVTLCLIVDLIARTHICVQIFTYLNRTTRIKIIDLSSHLLRSSGLPVYICTGYPAWSSRGIQSEQIEKEESRYSC